jgi:hypothetical protein
VSGVGEWSDRPAAEEKQGSRPLTTVVVHPPRVPGEPSRVEVRAREGLAREVLVGRALPLLARARRVLDEIADPTHGVPAPVWARDRAERMADAIADLIGHSTTDAPPADELEAVLAEGTPARLTWDQIRTLPRDCQDALTPDHLPAEPAVPAETPAEKAARYEEINDALEGMGIAVVPPCPMAPYAESSEPATRAGKGRGVDLARPVACDGCGARPTDGIVCLAPDGIHTWRPLDGPSNDELLARRNVPMRTGVPALDIRDEQLCRQLDATQAARRELSELATPVETPEALARRLDQVRNEAGSAYRSAIQAADEAWRAIGGRP